MLLLCDLCGLARKIIPLQLLFSRKAAEAQRLRKGLARVSKVIKVFAAWREKLSRDNCSSLAKPQRAQRLRKGWARVSKVIKVFAALARKISRGSCSSLAKPQRAQRLRKGLARVIKG